MRLFMRTLCAILVSAPLFVSGQTGCPGCAVNLPAGLPIDTVYLPPVPDGQVGVAYDQDLSFRMPKTTTPVAAIDSTTPPGISITNIEIVGLEGLPPGLSWEPNQTVFPVATQTDGCIKICGTPTISDSFVITVRLKATLFFISQEATFPMRIYIAPGVSVNDGFTFTPSSGCGAITVEFGNNVPSNGNPGFSYAWDFGDSTAYNGEQPPPHLYDTAGTYVVDYTATVDTTGYVLQSIVLEDVDCTDNFGLNAPDIYINVWGDSSNLLYTTAPNVVNNASIPLTINVGLSLEVGTNYIMQIYDEDGGLQGDDDLCGTFTFNVLSNGTVVSGGFQGILNIVRPITVLHYTDTIVVYPSPAAPVLSAPQGLGGCSDQAPFWLASSYASGNQWLSNGLSIQGATDSVYAVENSGVYAVRYTDANGCSAVSASLVMDVIPQPALPIFVNNQNLLTLYDTLALPDPYQLQWYLDTLALPSNGFWHCATESGLYGLEVVDPITGCNNHYELNVVYNPNFDCLSGTDEWGQNTVKLYPNPVSGILNIELGHVPQRLEVRDGMGRLVWANDRTTTDTLIQVFCAGWPNGTYILNTLDEKGAKAFKFTVFNPK